MPKSIVLAVATALAGLASLSGQAPQPLDAVPVAEQFNGLHFRSIGPAVMSGRFSDVAVYEKNPKIFYLASSHSGLWKTINDGVTFVAQFQDQGLMSIGDVAVSQVNPDVVWVGTGEANNRQSTSWGDGVYKSTDGGKTFRNMGLRQSFHINRIVIDPANENTVFVAAQGNVFGAGGDRGVFKTTDGGGTWKAVLTVDPDTGANDLAMDPSNSRVLYASTYQRRRSQCCFNGGGPGSGLWKSSDGGETWTRLTNGIPGGSLGRIGFDVYRKDPNIIYALIEAEGAGGRGGRGAAPTPPGSAGGGAPAAAAAVPPADAGGTGLYKSVDAGATWTKVSSTNPRPMYFSQIRIDPSNSDRLLIANVQVMLSTDGGKTFANADATIHDDIHAIWWDPRDSDHAIIGSDGGVGETWDGTKTWRFLPNLATGLFYHVDYDLETPFDVCGGMQDNDVWCGPSAIRTGRGIYNETWARLQIGDGMVTLLDKIDPRIIYSSTQDGSLQRKNRVTGESKSIRPGPSNVTPAPAVGETYRWHWDTPVMFSPIDPHVLLSAANKVFRSTDRGDSWTVISPDLTSNANRDDLAIMGVKDSDVRISRNDGISSWPTIVALAESPKQAGVYYTGTDDGTLSVSKDGGKSWQNITAHLTGLPAGAWISEVVPSRFDAATVYVTSDAHRLNDFDTHIWASHDFGATFESIGANMRGVVLKTLTEDLKNPDVLYAGAETGLYLTLDRGKSWSRLKANFPTVRVDEITLHPRDNAMIIATHGRAIWVLDHLEPIQEYAASQQASTAKLFSVPRAIEWRSTNDRNMEFWGDGFFLGENPPFDAVIQYTAKDATDVKLSIADASGKQIRQLSVPGGAGIRTACWDLRVEPIAAAGAGAPPGRGGGGGAAGGGGGAGGRGNSGPADSGPNAGFVNLCGGGGRGGGGGAGGGGGNNAGPLVPPDTYHVSLVVNGATVDTKSLRVVSDPAQPMTDAQQKKYFDIAMDLHDLQRRGDAMAAAIGSLYTQMSDLAPKVAADAKVPANVKAQFDAFQKEFDAVRVKFGVPAQAAGGGRGGGGAGGGGRGGGAPDPNNMAAKATAVKTQVLAFVEPPSDTLLRQYAEAKSGLSKAIADANAVIAKAMGLAPTLKKYDLTLNVPVPVK